MNNQEKLVEILKKKGIGPEGSKSLTAETLVNLPSLYQDASVSLTTKATLLTALLTLDLTPDEKSWLEIIRQNPSAILPQELLFFFHDKRNEFQNLILKTISKESLTIEECQLASDFLFQSETPEYLKASFLEAQRLKRESFQENSQFFLAFLARRKQVVLPLPYIVDLCDSYDGVERSPNYSLFTACVMAALGIPTYVHGLSCVAPKKGITHHEILKSAGKNPLLSLQDSSNQLLELGVTYVDQAEFFPELYNLVQMRTEMVKRPFLATFEKLLQPISASNGNFLVSPYTHKHYRMEVVNLLKEIGGAAKFIHLKGLEATSQPVPTRETEIIFCEGENLKEMFLSPQEFAIQPMSSTRQEAFSADSIVQSGVEALTGTENDAYTQILYQASVLLHCFLGWDKTKCITKIKEVLANRTALEKWTYLK